MPSNRIGPKTEPLAVSIFWFLFKLICFWGKATNTKPCSYLQSHHLNDLNLRSTGNFGYEDVHTDNLITKMGGSVAPIKYTTIYRLVNPLHAT